MKNLNKKIAVGLLLGSLCVTSIGTVVFASSQDNQESTPAAMCQNFNGDKRMHQKPHHMMTYGKEKLDKLVKDGVISEEQENKLVAFCKEKGEEMKAQMEKVRDMSQEDRQAYFQQMREQHPDFLGEIKNAAGLSNDQAKAVAEALRPHRYHGPQMNPEQLTAKLSKLVNGGAISQDQANSVVSFFKDKAAERRAERDKVKEMSPEERKAYYDEHHKNHPDMMSDLKAAASLSDEQAKTVADAIRPHHGPLCHGPQSQDPKASENQ